MIKCFAVSQAEAQVASFNDPRCDGGAVCPNDPLLFICTATDVPAASARVTLPSGVSVGVTNTNMTEVVSSGGRGLPDGVDIQSYSGMAEGGSGNYRITLAIERASLLGGNNVTCVAVILSPTPDLKSCPLATGITVIVPRAHLYIHNSL